METIRPPPSHDAGFTGSPPSGSSSSSSTCSSPSPFSPLPSPTPHRDAGFQKSMEEVWKDMNLPSPISINTHTKYGTSANPFPGMILQDFLPRSFDPSPAAAFGGPRTAPCPPPATTLSLNSPGQGQPQVLSHPSIGSLSFGSSISSAFDPYGSAPAIPSSCKKRANQESGREGFGDRRHEKMIKNRESAARSRARKQAYTHELELKLAQLVEENAKLKMHQEKLLAAAVQLPKKHTLGRTLTAPF